MASPLRLIQSTSKVVFRRPFTNLFSFKRTLLSQAYNCTEAWTKSIESPTYGKISLSEFAVQIHEQLDKHGRVSAVDMNILALQSNQLDEDEAEFVEDILKRFNQCQESYPPCQATSHALVRGYISAGLAHRLPSILSNRLTYGLFPDHYTLNLLLDHFIVKKDFGQAVRLAYYSTLQEDFSNPVNSLLSLQACIQFLASVNVEDLAAPPKQQPEGEEEEEEEWIKVKYIAYPYYDDHFDIKDQRFLLGKTLMTLSETTCVDVPARIRSDLKIMGAGLYQKFEQGLGHLAEIVNSEESSVSAQALDYFSNSLDKAASRDADEPEVEIGLRTIDDEIHKLLPTHEEKASLQSEFETLKEKLVSANRVSNDSLLEDSVSEFVTSTIASAEAADIDRQCSLFSTWRESQEAEISRQVFELQKNERVEEMKRQVQELQEQEELLEFFEKEEEIRLTFLGEDASKSDPKLSVTRI